MHRSIKELKGIGPGKAEILSESGITEIIDLLYYFPRRYIDRTLIDPMEGLVEGKEVTLLVRVVGSFLAHGKKTRLLVKCRTGTGEAVTLVWFHAVRFMQSRMKEDLSLVVSGKLEHFGGLQMLHPDFEILDEKEAADLIHVGRIVPLYPSSEKLKSKGFDSRGFRRLIHNALQLSDLSVPELLPDEILGERNLMERDRAIRTMHFPGSLEELAEAKRRLKYEELFLFGIMMVRKAEKRKRIDRELWPLSTDQSQAAKALEKSLPFQLTKDQKQAVQSILEFFGKDYPDSVLLQGDVGSGKTLVALLVALHYMENDIQVALMAPTEVLAKQHFRTISSLLGMESGYHVDLITGSDPKRKKEITLDRLSRGEIHLITGTHSLLDDSVEFQDLGLVIIDEQHRFGVGQRETLRKKGKNPDLIAMTATPIPRSLCLTEFADLNLVLLKEKPAGRKPIKTLWLKENRRKGLYTSIRNHIKKGSQVYIVFPLVEESEKLDLRAATEAYQELKNIQFPDVQVDLLHGKMKSQEKDRVLATFRNGLTRILVTTTVVEVGIDVPAATIMVIEHAERFGISQLHQLRGRVGRGTKESFCILMTPDSPGEDGIKRVQSLVDSDDGFYLSEVDLQMRGPGELLGLRQHGVDELKLADLVADRELAEQTAKDARNAGPLSQEAIAFIRRHFSDGIILFPN